MYPEKKERKMKLLLAEDERDLSNAIVRVLTYNKYDVDTVYDGQEALDYLAYAHTTALF